jgi:lycopene cyclase domain-containing protein
MDRFQYLSLMAACVAITLPLEFLFGARVWRRPRRLVSALGPVVAVFYVWDAVAIERGHWWFDERYVSGVVLPLGVPLEELVFFVVIPVCGLLTVEAVRNMLAGTTPVQAWLREHGWVASAPRVPGGATGAGEPTPADGSVR